MTAEGAMDMETPLKKVNLSNFDLNWKTKIKGDSRKHGYLIGIR